MKTIAKDNVILTPLLFRLELLLTFMTSDGVNEGRCEIETRGIRITDPLEFCDGANDGRFEPDIGNDGTRFTLFI